MDFNSFLGQKDSPQNCIFYLSERGLGVANHWPNRVPDDMAILHDIDCDFKFHAIKCKIFERINDSRP